MRSNIKRNDIFSSTFLCWLGFVHIMYYKLLKQTDFLFFVIFATWVWVTQKCTTAGITKRLETNNACLNKKTICSHEVCSSAGLLLFQYIVQQKLWNCSHRGKGRAWLTLKQLLLSDIWLLERTEKVLSHKTFCVISPTLWFIFFSCLSHSIPQAQIITEKYVKHSEHLHTQYKSITHWWNHCGHIQKPQFATRKVFSDLVNPFYTWWSSECNTQKITGYFSHWIKTEFLTVILRIHNSNNLQRHALLDPNPI